MPYFSDLLRDFRAYHEQYNKPAVVETVCPECQFEDRNGHSPVCSHNPPFVSPATERKR